jgi:hypothetical protein
MNLEKLNDSTFQPLSVAKFSEIKGRKLLAIDVSFCFLNKYKASSTPVDSFYLVNS